MRPVKPIAALASTLIALALQAQQKTPQQMIEAAVQTELAADKSDTSCWIYRDHDVTPEHDAVYLTAETPKGAIRRKLEDHGHPLTAAEATQEQANIQAFLGDRAKQQKQAKAAAHDDQEAENMLKLLPVAFTWTQTSDEGGHTTLAFAPNPGYQPHSMEARVLSTMTGTVIVDDAQNRIQTIKGTLTRDVPIGLGILGELHKGGTFNVERREVAPGHWQITDSHVHIRGRALLFKTIGEQEDETKTAFHLSTAKTFEEAAAEVKTGD